MSAEVEAVKADVAKAKTVVFDDVQAVEAAYTADLPKAQSLLTKYGIPLAAFVLGALIGHVI